MVSACKSPTASKSQAGLDFAQHDFVLKNTLDPQISSFKIQAQGMSRIVWRIPNKPYLKIQQIKKASKIPVLGVAETVQWHSNCRVTKSPKWTVIDAADWVLHIWICMNKVYPFGNCKAAWAI